MSVPKYKQNPSRAEFIENFNVIRKLVTFEVAKDFGLKSKTYTIKSVEKMFGIKGADGVALMDILNKNHVENLMVDKYPEWLVANWRSNIMNILNNIARAIYIANSIWINSFTEYYDRRLYLDEAIGYCMALEDQFQYIISCLSKDIDLNKYRTLFELIDKEIKLLKGLRTSDNKVIKSLVDRDPTILYAFMNTLPPHISGYNNGLSTPSYSDESVTGQYALKEMVHLVNNNKDNKSNVQIKKFENAIDANIVG